MCVLASVLPIDLQVHGRKLRTEGRSRAEVEAMTRYIWKKMGAGSTVAAWTKRLIHNLDAWLDRQHGEMNFYMTQLMSGYGCFGYYLKRIGKRDTPQCQYCGEVDDAEHTLFQCQRWERYCHFMTVHNLVVEIRVDWLLMAEENWEQFSRYAGEILRIKEEESRTRDRKTYR
ncbi:uncharacterized protein LOC142317563 [Lycorma delicatula]|uniref:uncharacterized protein LOC142317563 n=1 Tax=Lycorma delicatula TaxID=130591 RepID=UPI003F513C92